MQDPILVPNILLLTSWSCYVGQGFLILKRDSWDGLNPVLNIGIRPLNIYLIDIKKYKIFIILIIDKLMS